MGKSFYLVLISIFSVISEFAAASECISVGNHMEVKQAEIISSIVKTLNPTDSEDLKLEKVCSGDILPVCSGNSSGYNPPDYKQFYSILAESKIDSDTLGSFSAGVDEDERFPRAREANIEYAKMMQTIEMAIYKRGTKLAIDQSAILSKMAQIKLELITSIQQNASNLTNITDLIDKLNSVGPPLLAENLPTATAKQIAAFNNACLSGASDELAFDRTLNTVIICPGAILAAVEYGTLDSLSFSLAHELSHSIDSHSGVGLHVYDGFRSCLKANHASELKMQNGQDIDGVDAKLMELAADMMGTNAVAVHLGSVNKSQRLKLIRADLNGYCDEALRGDFGGEDIFDPHPSNIYRVQMFLKNPKIRDLLGCAQHVKPRKKSPPWCGLSK